MGKLGLDKLLMTIVVVLSNPSSLDITVLVRDHGANATNSKSSVHVLYVFVYTYIHTCVHLLNTS